MKKAILSVIVLMAMVTLQAQPEAGKIFIGGDVGINVVSQKFKDDGTITNEESYTTLTLLPKAGYFLSERLAVGIQTGISSSISRYPDDDPDKRSTTLFVFKPFGRYYFTTGTGGVFAESSLGIGAGKSRVFYGTGTVETNETSLSIDLSPGIYYYVTPSIALEAKFGVIGFSTNIEKDGNQKYLQNEFVFQLFPSGLSFGVSFML
jgi:outer membrane protein